MRILNSTKWPDSVLRDIIGFCNPSNVAGFDIAFKNSGWFHGRAWIQGYYRHERAMRSKGKDANDVPYIVIYIKHGVLPTTRYTKPTVYIERKKEGYLGTRQFTPHEDLVTLIAHELRHLWQAKISRGHRVWGARGQFSERDCDAYGIRMVRRWRREQRTQV